MVFGPPFHHDAARIYISFAESALHDPTPMQRPRQGGRDVDLLHFGENSEAGPTINEIKFMHVQCVTFIGEIYTAADLVRRVKYHTSPIMAA
jgi:hypothetical protein